MNQKIFTLLVQALLVLFAACLIGCGGDGGGCSTSGSCDSSVDEDCCLNENTMGLCYEGHWQELNCVQKYGEGIRPYCVNNSDIGPTCAETKE